MKKHLDTIVIAFLVLVGFTGTALAAGQALPADQSLLDLAKPVFDAVVHGQWWIAAASALILTMSAARKYAPTTGKFGWMGRDLESAPGVMVYTFAFSFAGAIITGLAALGPSGVLSFALVKTALLIGVTAIGAWKAIHSVAVWFVATDFYKNSVPAWAQSLIQMALALLGSNAIEKAETAGQAAVAAKPSADAAGTFTTL